MTSMYTTSLRLAVAASLLTVAPHALAAQDQQRDRDAFKLNESVPQGSWIRVRNMNGGIRVRPSTSDKVEVVAVKSWRRGDPKDVSIESHKGSDGSILVCAIWVNTRTTCTEDRYDVRSDENRDRRDRSDRGDRDRGDHNDVNVEFEVRVPKGVRVGVWTINGGLNVDGATSEVRAGTVNGGVDLSSTGGPVQGNTVNGSVHASMGRFESDQDLSYHTVNGSVIVEFAGDIDADVDLTTANGRFQTDWPVTLNGRIDPRHLHAVIGKGGRRIRMTTVNGSVELRKR